MSKDFTSMNNPRFLYLAEMHHPFPDYVAAEPMPAAEDFEKKASTAFADPARRLLPISTKSAAFHSALNMFAHPDDFEEGSVGRVKAACAHYGIEADILPYTDLFLDNFEKSASLDEPAEGRFAIDTTLGGEDFKLLPLNDADDVISSAFDLAKMAADNRVHLLMMVPAAREIVKAAADHGVDGLPEMVVRFGVARHADPDEAARLVGGREQFCKDATMREALAADYKEAAGLAGEDPDGAMEKIAAIDHTAGLEASYKISARVPNAFDVVFSGILESEAEKAAQEHVLVRDVFLPLDKVRAINDLDADYRLSKSASETFKKLRDTGDARDLSLAIENWAEADQRTFLRLTVDAAA